MIAPHDVTAVTVLVVDDEPDIRLLVRTVLQRVQGFEVIEEAVDGPTALDVLSRLDPPPVPTVIVLDNQMPGMSGLDVAANVLRDLPRQRIILFTAYLDEAVRERAHELGLSVLEKRDVGRLPELITSLAG